MSDPMVARDQLKSIVERIERLEEEKKAIADDIRDVYAEAKANGFDTKVLRQVIAKRKKDLTELQEEEAIGDLYFVALGMLPEFEADTENEQSPVTAPPFPPPVAAQQPIIQQPQVAPPPPGVNVQQLTVPAPPGAPIVSLPPGVVV